MTDGYFYQTNMEGQVKGEENFAIVSTSSQTWKIKLETPDTDIVLYLLSYAQDTTNIKDYARTLVEKTSKTKHIQ